MVMRVRANGFMPVGLLLLSALLNGSCSYMTALVGRPNTEVRIPTARVARGPVETKVYTLGELRPAGTATIVAPPISGGMLQIIYLAKTGTWVQKGDTIVEFDPSEQEFNLEQSRSQLEEADQQIIKLKADQAVKAAQNKVALLKAQYDVRRAEFKVQGNSLLSEIEAKKNLIDLEDAQRKYEQLQRDIQSRASSDAADLAVQNVARMKAQMGMKLAQQNIENMTWKAPTDGVVILGQNLEALIASTGGRIYSGMDIPEFREGDQVYPGRLVAQIQDTSELEILSKVLETDRGNLDTGQPVDVWMDSTPLKAYSGRIKSLATSASDANSASTTSDYLEALSTRSFDTIFEVNGKEEHPYLGVSVRVLLKTSSRADTISIPRQALFQKDSKPVVYSRRGELWEAHEVRIKYLTESRAVIDGIAENAEIALVNPDLQKIKAAARKGALASLLGGSAQ